MSILKLPLRFEGSKGEKSLYTLFDSGANLSCINEEFARELANLEPFLHPRKLATASEHHFIEIKYRISIDFYLNDVHLSDEFLVVPQLSEEAIIGAATMQKWRIKLDFEHDTVFVDPKVAKLQLI
jgi:predicted aspartyl protease